MPPPFYRLSFLALTSLWLAACVESAPTLTPTTVVTLSPTETTMLTATPAPTPTVAPTSTPQPTATLTPTSVPISLAARIAFVSERDSNREIYLLNTDG